jgi:hypothetical protein
VGNEAPAPGDATDARARPKIHIEDVDAGNSTGGAEPRVDTCSTIQRQQRYASRQQMVCGPAGDDGREPRCRWQLRFRNGEYEWQYTDMLISGRYVCDGLEIRAVTPEQRSGRLDPRTGNISWDGVEYVPVQSQ